MKRRIVDSKNIGIPIKIFENQYIDDALQGKIYFGSLQQYVDIEKKTGDQVVGDKNEGIIVHKNRVTSMWIRPKKVKDPISVKLSDNAKFKFSYGLNDIQRDKIGIASFTFLSLDNFQEYKKDGNKMHFELKQEVIRQIEQFVEDKERERKNSCGIVLFNPNDFLKALQKQGLSYGLVHYYDPNDLTVLKDIQQSSVPTYFYKSKKYAEQRELRIVSNLPGDVNGTVKTIDGLSGKKLSTDSLSELVLIIEGFKKID